MQNYFIENKKISFDQKLQKFKNKKYNFRKFKFKTTKIKIIFFFLYKNKYFFHKFLLPNIKIKLYTNCNQNNNN